MSPDPGSHQTREASGPGFVQFDEPGLIKLTQEGECGAFDQLVRHHQNMVYAVCMRMLCDAYEAEDVAQDVFVRAYRSIHSFRGESKFSTWLIAIAMNLCRNRRRWWVRRRRAIAGSLDEKIQTQDGAIAYDAEDTSPTPSDEAQSKETQEYILIALQKLSDAERKMIVLRDLQGYSYEEIGEILQVRVGTVKSRLNRARMQLRTLLDGWLHEV